VFLIEQLLKDSIVEAAQIGIELTESLQQLVVSGELLRDTEEVQMEGGDEVQEENVDCSEDAASEATRGNPDSLHSVNVIEIESSSESPSYSTSTSNSTSDSFDLDDVPLKYTHLLTKAFHHPPSSRKSQVMKHMSHCIHLFLRE